MAEVTVRKGVREDCKAIVGLIQELADFERMSDRVKIDSQTLEKDGFEAEHPLFVCYVAEIDKRIIGYALAYYTYSTWYGKAMYMEDICVTSDYRRKHVGTKLLKAIAKEAVDNNCCRLDFTVLEWNPAQEFYKKKGAINLTVEEGWHDYRFSGEALKKLASDV